MTSISFLKSLYNSKVKELVLLKNRPSYREEVGRVLISGKKMVEEVCLKREAKALFVLDPSLVPLKVDVDEIFVVTEPILKKITGLENPEGIAAEVAMPPFSSLDGAGFLLALEGISDPGNLGTLLRTALSFNWDGVFLLPGSCDPYNDKALRAAKGATFFLPMRTGTWSELKDLSKRLELKPYSADMEGEPLSSISNREKVLLVLGNEAQGLSREAKEFCSTVTIPMSTKVDSLNVAVAGGILMHGLKGIS